MLHLTKIPKYPPISNPSEQQGLVSNSRMSHPPYYERRSPNMFLTSFYGGPSAFPIAGSTWTRGFSAPTGLVAYDLRHVTFLVHFEVDGECDATPVEGGRGGELGGVAIFL